MRWSLFIAAATLSVCLGTIAPATETEQNVDPAETEPNRSEIYAGAGVILKGQPYKGVRSKVYPVPMFGYEGSRLYMYGISGGYRLIKGKSWSIGPVFQPRFMGYEAGDSRDLAGMDDRDWTLDLGAAWSWRTDYGQIAVSWVTDILGRHKGHEVDFSYTIMFPLAGFDIIPSAGVEYQSSNLVDYYYGVQPDERRAGRPAYEAHGAFDPYIRLAVRRVLNERWTLLLGGQIDWFDSEIKDSPIVEDSYDLSLLAGLLYSF